MAWDCVAFLFEAFSARGKAYVNRQSGLMADHDVRQYIYDVYEEEEPHVSEGVEAK